MKLAEEKYNIIYMAVLILGTLKFIELNVNYLAVFNCINIDVRV